MYKIHAVVFSLRIILRTALVSAEIKNTSESGGLLYPNRAATERLTKELKVVEFEERSGCSVLRARLFLRKKAGIVECKCQVLLDVSVTVKSKEPRDFSSCPW
jgi:hypothetical protein